MGTEFGFVRGFDVFRAERLSGVELELFERLKADVDAGIVFPAVRKGEMHFYYEGGCLYKFNGSTFARDKKYELYSSGTEGLNSYEKAKRQNKNRYSGVDGVACERQLLNRLYKNTFDVNRTTKVVVLDIEVRLNGKLFGDKKCDMVLMNTETNQLMFVEGKVFKDNRVLCAVGFAPKVIEQIGAYTDGILEQKDIIIQQYAEHIRIINALFGTKYEVRNSIVLAAKLVVYGVPKNLSSNGKHSVEAVNFGIGTNNVMWIEEGAEPSLDEIWEVLCREANCEI